MKSNTPWSMLDRIRSRLSVENFNAIFKIFYNIPSSINEILRSDIILKIMAYPIILFDRKFRNSKEDTLKYSCFAMRLR